MDYYRGLQKNLATSTLETSKPQNELIGLVSTLILTDERHITKQGRL